MTYTQTGTLHTKIIDKKFLKTQQDIKNFKDSINNLSFKINTEKNDIKKEKGKYIKVMQD